LDITWYGLSCFRITERGKTTVLTDPYSPDFGIEPTGTTKTDVVTISHEAPGHSGLDLVKGEYYSLTTPGEYEIGGTFITGVPMHYLDPENPRYNVGYLVNYGGLTVFHVGDLATVPDQSVVEGLGEVNVLLLPCGGGNSLTAALASEVVALIEPNYIVPMHYAIPQLSLELDDVDKFLKAMGVSSVTEEEVLKVSSGSLPEQPQVILLQPQIQP
jgi:L-ascorbate metabolism protein UlaG (beta-lactamase superfamily)